MRIKTLFLLCLFALGFQSLAFNQGIYINHSTVDDTPKFNYLIKQAKKTGINTFIVDLHYENQRYRENLSRLTSHGLKHVARVVVFEHGGFPEQVLSRNYWEKKFRLVEKAIDLGALEIQLDYIRYSSTRKPSSQNAKDIYKVIEWFKNKTSRYNVLLQIDVFGVASFGEVKTIGQSIPLFAPVVDAVCPMVYPSHYEPYLQHAVNPYETVYNSLISIKNQFKGKQLPFKLYPYIELSNYRYPLSKNQRLEYIQAQIKAAKDAGADGWYAWSANNHYDLLFEVLGSN